MSTIQSYPSYQKSQNISIRIFQARGSFLISYSKSVKIKIIYIVLILHVAAFKRKSPCVCVSLEMNKLNENTHTHTDRDRQAVERMNNNFHCSTTQLRLFLAIAFHSILLHIEHTAWLWGIFIKKVYKVGNDLLSFVAFVPIFRLWKHHLKKGMLMNT